MPEIEDLARLAGLVKTIIAAKKRTAAISGKNYSEMSPGQAQKNAADLSWLGMEIDKAMLEAHAAAVDCGIADARAEDRYGPVDYRPSPFHHYRHQPTKPRCRQ